MCLKIFFFLILSFLLKIEGGQGNSYFLALWHQVFIKKIFIKNNRKSPVVHSDVQDQGKCRLFQNLEETERIQ